LSILAIAFPRSHTHVLCARLFDWDGRPMKPATNHSRRPVQRVLFCTFWDQVRGPDLLTGEHPVLDLLPWVKSHRYLRSVPQTQSQCRITPSLNHSCGHLRWEAVGFSPKGFSWLAVSRQDSMFHRHEVMVSHKHGRYNAHNYWSAVVHVVAIGQIRLPLIMIRSCLVCARGYRICVLYVAVFAA